MTAVELRQRLKSYQHRHRLETFTVAIGVVAKDIGYSSSAIRHWLGDERKIRPNVARDIRRVTDGAPR